MLIPIPHPHLSYSPLTVSAYALLPSSLFSSLSPLQEMPDSREDSVYLAKLAEQAERYEGPSATR